MSNWEIYWSEVDTIMSNEERAKSQGPDEEDRLKALFDRTALEPSREALDRLARHAAAVPEGARHGWLAVLGKRWWSPLALAFAAATVAATALVVWRAPGGKLSAPVARMVLPSARAADGDPPEMSDEPTLEELEEAVVLLDTQGDDDGSETLDEDPLSVLDAAAETEGPLAVLDLLIEPDDDALFDRWADALESYAERTP